MGQQAQDTSYAARVWKGDPSTVAEAFEQYRQDGNLLSYAMALYSFRHISEYATRLVELRTDLWRYSNSYVAANPLRGELMAYANEGDALSTYLEWLSRRTDISEDERNELRRAMTQVTGRAFINARLDSGSNHTWCLLGLTLARSELAFAKSKNRPYSRRRLDDIAASVRIPDANQRVRVFRKLGMLYRMMGKWWTGTWWGVRAIFVRGVPLTVRAKSIAAFFIEP